MQTKREIKIAASLARVSTDYAPEQVYTDPCSLALAHSAWNVAYMEMYNLKTTKPTPAMVEALEVAAEEVDRLHLLVLELDTEV